MMQIREFLFRTDVGYIASFDPKDAELVKKYQARCNLQEYRIQSLFDKFDRFNNDHKPTIYGKRFEPLDLTITGNKLVTEGLIALAEFQVGKRTKQFTYYAIGDDDTAVSITDDHLFGECARVNILTTGGTFIQRQSTIFYSVFFPKTVSDCTVRETGIMDASTQSTDIMLLRTALPTNQPIPHKKNFDTTFVAHIIYSGSV